MNGSGFILVVRSLLCVHIVYIFQQRLKVDDNIGILSNGNYLPNMGKRVQAHLSLGVGAANGHGLLGTSFAPAPPGNDLNSSGRSPSLSPKSSPHHNSNDALNSSASVSSGVGSQNSSVMQTSFSPGSNLRLADDLSQLIRDKERCTGFQQGTVSHVERLDEGISKVRVNLFQADGAGIKESLELPEEQGASLTQTEKVFIPVEERPDFNFVGRILGPRGLTAKQLEKETQCKIMIRGKGSMQKESQNKGTPNWEHLDEQLHVLISVEDTLERGRIKLNRAAEEIRKLLVPMSEGDDELKKRQLMELAIINGTFRDNSPKAYTMGINPMISQYYVDSTAAAARVQLLANQAMVQAAARQQTLGAPLMMQATDQHVNTSGSSPRYYHASGSPVSFTMQDTSGSLLNPYEYAAAAASYNPALADSLLNGDYTLESIGAVGGFVIR